MTQDMINEWAPLLAATDPDATREDIASALLTMEEAFNQAAREAAQVLANQRRRSQR